MPVSAVLSRSEFLEWVGNPKPAWDLEVQYGSVLPPPRHVALVWISEHPDHALDPMIAVPADELREFLAFTSTYIGSYSPFTAFYRVIPSEIVAGLPEGVSLDHSIRLTPLIGAAIVDAALNIGRHTQRVSDVTIQAVLASSIAVAVNAAGIGYDNMMVTAALERWIWAKNAISGEHQHSDESAVAFCRQSLAVLLPEGGRHLGVDDEVVSETLRDLMSAPDKVSGLMRLNGGTGAPGFDMVKALRSSREDRVKALEALAVALRNSTLSHAQRDLMLGYACAQVADGSFGYLGLAAKWTESFPAAGLWFGFFASMHPESDVLTTGLGLGRRVQRKLFSPSGQIAQLSADVGFEELLMVREENKVERLRTEVASVLQVEIFPGVSARYRFRSDRRRSAEPSLGSSHARELTEAQALVARLSQIVNVIAEAERAGGVEPERGDQPLFPFSNPPRKTAPTRGRSRAKK